jgi:hypothetical protein
MLRRSSDGVYQRSGTGIEKVDAVNVPEPKLSVMPVGESFPVRSDTAQYRLLRQRTLSNGHLEVLTERTGSSGTSYARREIDCDAGTFRYLGEGDTQAEAEQDGPKPGAMGKLIYPSISSETAQFACAKTGKQALMH